MTILMERVLQKSNRLAHALDHMRCHASRRDPAVAQRAKEAMLVVLHSCLVSQGSIDYNEFCAAAVGERIFQEDMQASSEPTDVAATAGCSRPELPVLFIHVN